MENYKICILAAGVGSRMGALSENISKAVLPVNFKGVISYIIEKFPKEIECVIAVGHKKETVIDYLAIAHPERKFTFVEIDKYIGPGSGPGYSLLQCKDQLQCSFILCTADTIVLEEIQEPNENWFGIAPTREPERCCTVKIKNNLIYQLDDKIKCDNKFAFIGLAGIKDYEEFFQALEKNTEQINGEIQVSNGFKKLIEKKLVPIGFTWLDTGTLTGYIETNNNFSGGEKKFDFSKGDEFLYFINGKVVKYFANTDIVNKRCIRAEQSLKGLCPEIDTKKDNFYSYKKIDGETLYSVLNNQLVTDFLYWAKRNLWTKKQLSTDEQIGFTHACKAFYYDKTMKRIEAMEKKRLITDSENCINGVSVPQLRNLFNKVDWSYIQNGIPSNFHGDLQFDNILVTRDKISNLQKFILLDWRQDFGGLVTYGDVYYDLAKLYGGMTLSYQLIKEGKFSFDMSGSSIYYNYHIKNDLLEAKEIFENFIKKEGYDLDKVKIITAIIFLNMSPLHNDPFDNMLYYMGKAMLHRIILQKNENKEVSLNYDESKTGNWTNESRDYRSSL
ncbi:MAG: hypothetical protein QT08_C0009G0103 [archaeon GW2011_AR17]|nr:MAG: hypothetical protein QT08_C0009G0103 [archaeon GW2011_AR17]MBS3154105.1 hypothetical protein [Candidatus Woesearchaeota archaeon]HIH14698.1 hypothetical protein [Nanoarchaeota archaeon]HIH59150.1 hypothetical protein [Nanoarchaeota archaeon]HII14378.1 hypothetical protein [Nanoarchaeota archaeon]